MTEFSFRWGVDLFDNERTTVPNWILANYHLVEWRGETVSGVGISNTEMMFVIHLASFRYESEKGQASPSLTGTLAKRMNYRSNQGIINVEQGLVDKGLLLVTKRAGKTSIYDFTPFSEAIIRVIQESSRKVDDYPSTKIDDLESKSSTKLDGSRQEKLTQRKEEKENQKEEGEDKNKKPLPLSLDNHQSIIDQVNGSQSEALTLLTRHYYGGCMEYGAPADPPKAKRKKWEIATRTLFNYLPDDLKTADVRDICTAIDWTWEYKRDPFWSDMPCKDETLIKMSKAVAERLKKMSEQPAQADVTIELRDPLPEYEQTWKQVQTDLLQGWTTLRGDTKATDQDNGTITVVCDEEADMKNLRRRQGNIERWAGVAFEFVTRGETR